MKKLTLCLLPLVGLIVGCGGEGDQPAATAPPPAVQEPAKTGPNGEQSPLQPAISPPTVDNPGGNEQTCDQQCSGDATCVDTCCTSTGTVCQQCLCGDTRPNCRDFGECD